MEEIKEARMLQKHDVADNWDEVSDFIPKAGEIIIYDKDSNTSKQRLKVGDGETSVENLAFITGEIYAQREEPKNAGEGAIWVVPDGTSNSFFEENGLLPDFSENDNGKFLSVVDGVPVWITVNNAEEADF